MVSVGRALMSEPSVLMLDEPSFGLAPLVTHAIYSAMTTMLDQGLAVLVVEERPDRALDFVDDVIVLERGRMIESVSASRLDRAALVERMNLSANPR